MDLMVPEREPTENEIAALAQAPSGGGLAVAIGLLAAAVLTCTGYALEDCYVPTVLCAPLFVGAVVGVCSRRNAIKNTATTVLVLLALRCASLTLLEAVGLSPLEAVVGCLFALPIVMPMAFLGATCGHAIRCHVLGRRARAWLGG